MESYPLLTVRKPAPTVAGDSRDAEGGPSGVHSGILSGVHSGSDGATAAAGGYAAGTRRGRETEEWCLSRSHLASSEGDDGFPYFCAHTMASTSAGRERSPPLITACVIKS